MELPLRRRAWLSREGWYYLAVLGFIVGGAVLRNVNLLVVLAGMMLAPLVLNWRLVMASLRGLTVRRRLPSHATAGEPLTVELLVTNHRASFSSWLVQLQDRVELIEEQPKSLTATSLRAAIWDRLFSGGGVVVKPKALLHEAPAGATTTASYRLTIARRGRYRFGPATISTRYPVGLVRGNIEFDEVDELIVFPRLGRLSDKWDELTEADLLGEERSHPQRGFAEGDYYGLRPWQSGDSQRWVHWRTTAKLNTPIVRQFERQRSHDLAIVLDPWLPENPTEEDQGKLELAISLAATAVADMGSRGGGTLTFAIASEAPQVWNAPASPIVVEEILFALAAVAGSPTPNWPETLAQLQPHISAAGVALAISPRSREASPDESPTSDAGQPPADDSIRWVDAGASDIAELFELA